MAGTPLSRFRLGKLELLLPITAIVLFFQLFPDIAWALLGHLDVTQWTRSTWLGFNVVIVVVLCLVRFGAAVPKSLQARRHRAKASREAEESRRAQQEQRELLKRLQEGRKRHLY
jgi:type VI protein secretion system component VasK